MNVSSLMTAQGRFRAVHHQSPPLAALHHMMETKIPRAPSPPAAALPVSSLHAARSYQPPSSLSSTPHRIHNILGRATSSSLPLSPEEVAAGFAAAAAAAAGLVVDPAVCLGYTAAAVPPAAARVACNAGRTPCGPPGASSSLWSNQTGGSIKLPVSSVADWNHAVAGAFRAVQFRRQLRQMLTDLNEFTFLELLNKNEFFTYSCIKTLAGIAVYRAYLTH